MMKYMLGSNLFPFRVGISIIFGVLLLLFAALIIVTIVLLVKWSNKRNINTYVQNQNSSQFTQNEALNILNIRFAKGEITEEEYKVKKELILK